MPDCEVFLCALSEVVILQKSVGTSKWVYPIMEPVFKEDSLFSRWLIELIVLTLLGKMTTYVSGRNVQYFCFFADFYNTMLIN